MEEVELKEILRDPSQPYLYKRRLYWDDSSGVSEFFGVAGSFPPDVYSLKQPGTKRAGQVT